MNATKQYYRADLPQKTAESLKAFLKENEIYFEPSSCYDLVHFEVLANPEEIEKINKFLDSILN